MSLFDFIIQDQEFGVESFENLLCEWRKSVFLFLFLKRQKGIKRLKFSVYLAAKPDFCAVLEAMEPVVCGGFQTRNKEPLVVPRECPEEAVKLRMPNNLHAETHIGSIFFYLVFDMVFGVSVVLDIVFVISVRIIMSMSETGLKKQYEL